MINVWRKITRQKLDARLGARIKFLKSSTPLRDTELDKLGSLEIVNRAIDSVMVRNSRAASQSALSERLIKRSSSTVLSEEADLTSTVDSFG